MLNPQRLAVLATIALWTLTSATVHADDGSATPAGEPAPRAFLRGDTNGDGGLDLADAAAFIGAISQTYTPPCLAAADFDADGLVDLSDLIDPLAYLFAAGSPPPAPFPACDVAVPGVGLDCSVSTCAP